jgi:Na+/H+ antiporter NhaD/arsenite permease-like protein
MPFFDKMIVMALFIACYALALSGRVKLAYTSLGATALLLALGLLSPYDAVFKAINWDVLGIYWGFMMVSFIFMKSRMPERIANRILASVKTEKYVILALSAFTAFLSAFMENVGVVLMMAPVAIAVSRRMGSSLFHYMIAIAISSNVVTTLTMVADPPSIILAMETGMKPLDFYWYEGRPGLGTITLAGVLVALATLVVQFRWMNRTVEAAPEAVPVTWGATGLFVVGVAALMIGPEFGLRPGVVGLAVGILALVMGREDLKEMLVEFDWNSLLFIMGVFMVIYTLNDSGLLKDLAELVINTGVDSPSGMMAFLTWISVALSSFMDNVPYTILMIPVCKNLAAAFDTTAWAFLYGMLIGTGIGGNITPVGATANVFACGVLEKQGVTVSLIQYLKISIPFSVAAVATCHILLQIFWM